MWGGAAYAQDSVLLELGAAAQAQDSVARDSVALMLGIRCFSCSGLGGVQTRCCSGSGLGGTGLGGAGLGGANARDSVALVLRTQCCSDRVKIVSTQMNAETGYRWVGKVQEEKEDVGGREGRREGRRK